MGRAHSAGLWGCLWVGCVVQEQDSQGWDCRVMTAQGQSLGESHNPLPHMSLPDRELVLVTEMCGEQITDLSWAPAPRCCSAILAPALLAYPAFWMLLPACLQHRPIHLAVLTLPQISLHGDRARHLW